MNYGKIIKQNIFTYLRSIFIKAFDFMNLLGLSFYIFFFVKV